MKKFIVTDEPARFGEGAVLGLTAAQLADRAHNVDPLAAVEQTHPGFTIVKAARPLEFRVGEELLVEGEEATVALVNPITGQRQSQADRARSARQKAVAKKAAKAPAKRR